MIKQIVPLEKIADYIRYCKNKKVSMFCECGKLVETELTPYFYDEEENDVYFASICPHCGKLLITKE